jgi:hypothetical protein
MLLGKGKQLHQTGAYCFKTQKVKPRATRANLTKCLFRSAASDNWVEKQKRQDRTNVFREQNRMNADH